METVWRGLNRAALDRAYNARDSVPDADAELRRYATLSEAARTLLQPRTDLVFDRSTGLALDWFAGKPAGPVLVWIHGGYWRALSKADQSFVAAPFVAAGVHVVIIDYQLAPAATLQTIVHQVRTAMMWISRHAAEHGADPTRLFVAGHSAGAHLAGMLLAPVWQREYGLAPDAISGAIALSGLYDLEPIRLSYVNDWLSLDARSVQRLSPLHQIPPPGHAPRLLLSYGGLESDEFRHQSEDYAAAWHAAGHHVTLTPQPGRNHFDLLVGLGQPTDPLALAALELIDA